MHQHTFATAVEANNGGPSKQMAWTTQLTAWKLDWLGS